METMAVILLILANISIIIISHFYPKSKMKLDASHHFIFHEIYLKKLVIFIGITGNI